jgi:uncharacterized membrane protein
MSAIHWLGVAVIAGVIGLGVFGTSDREQQGQDELLACQKRITQLAANPSGAEVPYTKPRAVRGGFVFEWAHGDGLRLQNGFGAMVDTPGSCAHVDGRIVEVVLGDQVY